MLINLDRLGVGLGKVESYMTGLVVEFRSKKFREQGAKLGEKVIKESMVLKIQDEKQVHRELNSEKCELRRESERLFGKDSRRQRRLIKHLRQEAARTKKDERKKYLDKAENLDKKWRNRETKSQDKVPTGLEEYKDAKVFSRKKYEEIEEEKIEIEVLGDVTISEEANSSTKTATQTCSVEET